jgi:integrase
MSCFWFPTSGWVAFGQSRACTWANGSTGSPVSWASPCKGQSWLFSPHQFRKTFARFVAKRDRTQLFALSDHFKHVSIAMTAKSYVGSDFKLQELISEESQA